MRMNSTDWTRQWGKHLEILAFKSPQRIFYVRTWDNDTQQGRY